MHIPHFFPTIHLLPLFLSFFIFFLCFPTIHLLPPMAPPQIEWTRGDPIEVAIPEPGFENSWYPALHLASFPKYKQNFVRYTTLVEEDGITPLRELVPTKNVRPAPPQICVLRYAPGDHVDAYTRDGWWEAVVVRMVGQLVEVSFPVPPESDEVLYRVDHVRVHLRYNREGEWVL